MLAQDGLRQFRSWTIFRRYNGWQEAAKATEARCATK